MSFTVRWGEHVARKAQERFGTDRSSAGRPGEHDFVAGPLASAVFAFRDFDALPQVAGPSIRSAHIVDSVFGVVVFIGVLTADDTVEIADFADDPGYWSTIDRDPDQ